MYLCIYVIFRKVVQILWAFRVLRAFGLVGHLRRIVGGIFRPAVARWRDDGEGLPPGGSARSSNGGALLRRIQGRGSAGGGGDDAAR